MCIKQLVSWGWQVFASPHTQSVSHPTRRSLSIRSGTTKQCLTALSSLVFVLWLSACRCQTSLPVSAYAVKLYEIVTAVCDSLFLTLPSHRDPTISYLIQVWIFLLRFWKFHYAANVGTNGRITPAIRYGNNEAGFQTISRSKDCC